MADKAEGCCAVTRRKWPCCPYPTNSKCISSQITLYIMIPVVCLSFAYMVCMIVWAPVDTVNNQNSESQLEGTENQLKLLQIMLGEINEAIEQCEATCGMVHCNSCCPSCKWTPAPAPPTNSTVWKFPTSPNNQCPGGAYAAIVGSVQTTVCRLGNINVNFCGFLNDYSISLLESPLDASAPYGNGTIVASRIASSIVQNAMCVSLLGSYGVPGGLSLFTLQGDQTGYTVSFISSVIDGYLGSLCNAIVCPSLNT